MVGRSVAWVSQVERGVRKVDRMSVLEALAAALGVPLAELAAEAPIVASVIEEPPGASNAASLSPAASCQPVPVTLRLQPGWCPVTVAELL